MLLLHQSPHLLWLLPLLPLTFRCFLGNLFIIILSSVLLRPKKDGAATGVDAICIHHADTTGPGLDNERVFWELSNLTNKFTQLGPYTLDKNSLYINGEQWPCVFLSRAYTLLSQPPLPHSTPFSLFYFLFRLYTPDPVHHISK